jgi:hypothetical protein
MIGKSSAYAAEVILVLEVLKVYPLFPLSSHRKSGSRKIINRYGLSMSPCIVSIYMGIGCVLPKYSLMYVVVNCEWISPINAIVSCG